MTTTPPADVLADRYRRLDAFLQKLRGDIYPEPPSPVHTGITQQMFAELMQAYPQPSGARVLDLNLQTAAGPDTYWAFIQQKRA